MPSPHFTVFTPTYNRLKTLPRTYASLVAQTDQDFEWLVVDDGSQDGTAELIESWSKVSPFPIRYHWQSNRGKHTAVNAGAQLARGEYFLSLDSDDEMMPEALAVFRREWNAIPAGERKRYSGISALCIDQHSELVGDRYPSSPLDCSAFEMQRVLGIKGEKFWCRRTEVMQQFKFPESDGVRNVPEAFITIDMDKHYLVRYINETCRVYGTYWPGSDQITHSFDMGRFARGHAIVNAKVVNEQSQFLAKAPIYFVMSAARFVRFSLHDGTGLIAQASRMHGARAKALWIASLPLGVALRLRDHFVRRNRRMRKK